MQFEFSYYSIILIVSGIAASLFSAFVFNRLGGTLKWFVFTLIGISIWAFAYGFKISSLEWNEMLFWVKVEYLGIAIAPSTWLLFCIKYTGKESWLKPQVLLILIAFPIITYLIVLTNEWHHLHFAGRLQETSNSFPYLAIQKGPWFLVHTIYFYFTVLLGNYLLITSFKRAEPIYKKHTLLLIVISTLPWLVNIFYLLGGFKPFGPIDPTPFTFIVSYALIAVGLFKFNLFDVLPIAKDKLIKAMTEGILVIDLNGKVMDLNPAMKRIIKGKGGSYIGHPVELFFSEQQELMKVINDRRHSQIEVSIDVKKDPRQFLVEAIPILEKQTEFIGLLLLFRDITEIKKSQHLLRVQSDELKHLNDLKDKLFSIISHDLKGPIQGIKEIIDLAKRGLMTADDFQEILPDISKSVDGVTMLMENLLGWSRSQLKGEYMHRINFDVYKLILQQVTLMESPAASKNIKLEILGEGPLMVFADRNMVELIIRNLLNNSLKFCEPGDRIQISGNTERDGVRISVKDTGLGISPNNLERLRKGDSFSTFGSNNETGTGLGLLLVRDYVEKNGGSLTINSEENEWSEFSFMLSKASVGSGGKKVVSSR